MLNCLQQINVAVMFENTKGIHGRAVGIGQPGQPWGWPGFSSLANSHIVFSENKHKLQIFKNSMLSFSFETFSWYIFLNWAGLTKSCCYDPGAVAVLIY